MAQLTDDCFAFSGPLLPLGDMERLICERVVPVAETERVGLRGARGRVAAADVMAPADLPPFDNSAVDGDAVRHADLRGDGDTRLAVAGRLTAGARADIALKPGQAIRIFTGAAMPAGAELQTLRQDHVIAVHRHVFLHEHGVGARRHGRAGENADGLARLSAMSARAPAVSRPATASLVSPSPRKSAWRTA